MSTLEQTLERIESSLARIAEALENAHPFKYTPEGDPICPRHHEPMKKREKQGDTWYSHTVTDPATGEVSYCRGYPGKSSPGWSIQASHPASHHIQSPVKAQDVAPPASDLASAIRELKGGRQ